MSGIIRAGQGGRREGPVAGRERFCLYFLLPLLAGGGAADDGRFYSGAYSYSDEMGGFHILDVSGIGTQMDPVVIREDLPSAGPVTLVIRAARPIQPFGATGDTANGFLHLRIVAENGSGIPWVGFGFELQEVAGRPSTFNDGLSFDQRNSSPGTIGSDRFAACDREFEPYDRLLFHDGHVDPQAGVRFDFPVTDFTPDPVFYILEDPRIPAS